MSKKIYEEKFKRKTYEVELNFPDDMKIVEDKMAETLADIVVKKFGSTKSFQIADELERRLEED